MFFARTTLCVMMTALLAIPSACSSSTSDATPHGTQPDGSAGSVGCSNSASDGYEPGLKKAGQAGKLEFALLSSSPAPPALDDNTFVVQVTDSEGNPVEGELSVALDMPEHGHPSPALPTVTYDADSRAFTLDPMRLFMVGLWRITFSFVPAAPVSETDGEGDSAVFEFCID